MPLPCVRAAAGLSAAGTLAGCGASSLYITCPKARPPELLCSCCRVLSTGVALSPETTLLKGTHMSGQPCDPYKESVQRLGDASQILVLSRGGSSLPVKSLSRVNMSFIQDWCWCCMPYVHLKRQRVGSASEVELSMYRRSLVLGGLTATHHSTALPCASMHFGPEPAS